MCYLPGLVVSVSLGLAWPALVLGRHSVQESLVWSVTIARERPAWLLFVVMIGSVSMAVVSYIPCVGVFVAVPGYALYQIRAHRVAETLSGE